MSQLNRKAADPGLSLGFIGAGAMGYPMIERLFEAGLNPVAHDANKEVAAPLTAKGVKWADSLAELSSQANIVLLSLPGPPQVEEVVGGNDGLLERLEPGSIIVDLSTSSFATSQALAERCRQRRIGFLDSPVSGGIKGCREGSLVLMVGGDSEALEQVRPVLEILSRKIVHLGDSGAGNVAKLINNQLYLCGEIIFYEGLVLANKAGLDLPELLDILDSSGAGGVHTKVVNRVLQRQYDDNIFKLSLAEKDVRLSVEAGQSLEVPMPVTGAALKLFQNAIAAGYGDKNFWSTIEMVEQPANTHIEAVQFPREENNEQ